MATPPKPTVVVTLPKLPTAEMEKVANVIKYGAKEVGEKLRRWVAEQLPGADVLCLSYQQGLTIDAELLSAASGRLRGLVTMSVGHDNIDLDECRKRGLRVGFSGPALTEVTAEHTVALLLATSFRIPQAWQAAKEGLWPLPAGRYSEFYGKLVTGSTIGFFGMGRIGQSAAAKLRSFKPREIIYNCRKPKPELDGLYEYVPFERLLERSDFLVVVADANPGTVGVFNRAAFDRMKPDAVFINVARGVLVNTDDLTLALSSFKLRAAGLDVTDPEPLPIDHPLFSLPNCVILPHIGGASESAVDGVFEMATRNVMAILRGGPMPSPLLDVDHSY